MSPIAPAVAPKVSVGLGLTNECNLSCAHCYRPAGPAQHLQLAQIRRVVDEFDVAGVNLGTGESACHPQFHAILTDLLARGQRVSLTSNGLSVAALDDAMLQRLGDVEISIDFADRDAFDAFRGRGAWAAATGALERCARLGVATTVLAVLMRANCRELVPLARLAASLGAPLRINLYQSVHTPSLAPTWDELWSAVDELTAATTLLAVSEPVIKAAARIGEGGLPCGRTSLRITPMADVRPCVYWPDSAGSLSELTNLGEVWTSPVFEQLAHTPAACLACDLVAICGGGCASRRRLAGALDAPDPYCPRRGGADRRIHPRFGKDPARLHTGNVCTLLVSA